MAAKKRRRRAKHRRSAFPLIAVLAGAAGIAIVALQLLPEPGGGEPERQAAGSSPAPAPEPEKPRPQRRPVPAAARPEPRSEPAPVRTVAVPPPRPERRAGVPKVAVVIDDCGYDLDIARRFAAQDIALTFAVIPHLPGSEDCAEAAYAAGHEVILHQPMEPSGYPATNPGEGALLVGMGRNQVAQRLRENLEAIPHVSGVNNHMGSAATADPDLMDAVMGTLRGLESRYPGLYFLDSKTSASTVAYDTARRAGIPTALRKVFLDHDESPAAVRAKFQELLAAAEEEGEAIGIGHFKAPTLAALEATLAQLDPGEFDFVYASELAR